MLLVQVGHLERAHAVVRHDHEQRSGDERKREHAGLFHAHQLGDHDGEEREHHAPCRDAQGVAHVVARGAVCGVLFFLAAQRSFGNGAEQAVAPSVDGPLEEVGLAWLALACSPTARRTLPAASFLWLRRMCEPCVGWGGGADMPPFALVVHGGIRAHVIVPTLRCAVRRFLVSKRSLRHESAPDLLLCLPDMPVSHLLRLIAWYRPEL